MTKPHFTSWDKIEEGYYTKTKLRDDFGVKPIAEEEYDATLRARTPRGWGDFLLYHLDKTVEIKRRKVIEVEMTDSNLAQALYVINKSAKVSRDTKGLNYEIGNYNIVSAAKTRQNRLYKLKDLVIKKLLEEGKIRLLGYHKQKNNWNDEYMYLMLGEIDEFQFHLPTTHKDVKAMDLLGEIERIPAEKTREVNFKFHESQNLLERYIAKVEVHSQE